MIERLATSATSSLTVVDLLMCSTLVAAAQSAHLSTLDYIRGSLGYWLGIKPDLVTEDTPLKEYDPLVATALEGAWEGELRLSWKKGDPVSVILRQLEGHAPLDEEPPQA